LYVVISFSICVKFKHAFSYFSKVFKNNEQRNYYKTSDRNQKIRKKMNQQ
jgi:hypothetical protein